MALVAVIRGLGGPGRVWRAGGWPEGGRDPENDTKMVILDTKIDFSDMKIVNFDPQIAVLSPPARVRGGLARVRPGP